VIKTFDGRFIIKEITNEEKQLLALIAKDYLVHIKDNPKTLLSKIYGFFTIKKAA
jgi:1-phosphatidylinositol-4-phosphate 5-kinase